MGDSLGSIGLYKELIFYCTLRHLLFAERRSCHTGALSRGHWSGFLYWGDHWLDQNSQDCQKQFFLVGAHFHLCGHHKGNSTSPAGLFRLLRDSTSDRNENLGFLCRRRLPSVVSRSLCERRGESRNGWYWEAPRGGGP